MLRLTISLFLISCFTYAYSASNTEKINNASFFGIKILESNVDSVKTQLWNIGGFTQARSTQNKRAIDKFFISYQARDSYYIKFRYTSNGKLISAKRLYRPNSIHFKNKHGFIQTSDVARKLMKDLGQPTQIITRTNPIRPYSKYKWETDKLTIIIDRVGSQYLGNVFILYKVKTDPYFVASVEITP